jgi:hypothetical protein
VTSPNSEPTEQMLNDVEGLQLVQAIHDRKACVCTNWCSDDKSLITCPHCLTLDVYDPCPIVGFGCGLDCGDDEHCTPEQQNAASK